MSDSILSRASIPLHELPWSVRLDNIFANENLKYLGDVAEKTGAELLRLPNLGRKSLDEIKAMLCVMGLQLGMALPDGWRPVEE
jgi:DNA-directed RNA polymerase subunit alpha